MRGRKPKPTRLKLEWPTEEALDEGGSYPPGACHFPQYGEEYFKQLTAERLVTRIVKGFPRGSWEKEPGHRNEALDCRVYARAAATQSACRAMPSRRWISSSPAGSCCTCSPTRCRSAPGRGC